MERFNISTRPYTDKRHYINIERFALSGLIFSSLIVYLFIGMMNSVTPFVVLFCLFTLLYMCGKRLAWRRTIGIEHVWLLALTTTVLSFCNNASFAIGNSVDLVVIVCAVFIIFNPPKTSGAFTGAIHLITAFAVFYAVSIWIQILLPSVYKIFLGGMKNGSEARIQNYTSYYTGFTTNPGHTSQYILAGVLAIVSHEEKRKKWLLAFLIFSFLFTGKRIDAAAIILVICYYYLNKAPSKKVRRIVSIAILFPIIIMLFFVFEPLISQIPVVSRITNSIVDVLSGNEIASDRTRLSALAYLLFHQNPALGIGWGNFKENVVGNVTYRIKFDVHNIYLQLLCECGIVGFVLFMIVLIVNLAFTIKYFRALAANPTSKWTKLISFSMMYQMFFLVLGFLDNTLYNLHTLVCYIFCCLITVAYSRYRQQNDAR